MFPRCSSITLPNGILRKAIVKVWIDFSLYEVPLFEDATNYPLILAVEKRRPEKDRKFLLTMINRVGQRRVFETEQSQLPLLPAGAKGKEMDPESPFCIAPPEAIRSIRKMQATGKLLGELIVPAMGIKTSANKVFFVRKVEPTDRPNEVWIITEGNEGVRIEKQLIKPLLRGENIKAWEYEIKNHIIWTHDDKTGKPLTKLPSRACKYFEAHKDSLRKRSDYREGMPIWTIFRVNRKKLGPKVVFQRIGPEIRAAFVPEKINDACIIPDSSTYFLPVPSYLAGLALAAWLNSLPIRTLSASFVDRLRGAYFQFHSWSIAILPLPKSLEKILSRKGIKNDEIRRLIEISALLHENPQSPKRDDFEKEISQIIASFYGLSEKECKVLEEFWSFVRASGP